MSSTVSTVVRPTLFSHLPSPAHSTVWEQQQRSRIPPPLGLKRIQKTSLADEAALVTGGLRTPPVENSNMSTAYQNPSAAILPSAYDSHVSLIRQPATFVQASRAGGVFCDANLAQNSQNQPQQQYQQPQSQYQSQQAHHASSLNNNTAVQPHSASSRHSTRPSTPSSTSTNHVHSEGTVSRRDSTMVMHSLHLPSCISPNGGNLDDFAALMTCFFWFENMETIQAAERIKDRHSNSSIPPLSKHTRPCPAYKKWVNSILSTTQVTQNVILLALLFVYRLKSTNPKVNGSPGSEYRLLTVALMLGNKFLDDNTYTNKTWAEVSGIPVKEIHVMEVEFLSNMRYGLLTSAEQWQEWLKKLACFHEYCEKAEIAERAAEMAAARRQRAPMAPLNLTSPSHARFSSPLPSPSNVLPSSSQGTPSSLSAYSPNSAVYNSNHNWPPSYQSTPAMSPLAAKPQLTLPKKRGLEGAESAEPAPKRMPRQASVSLPPNRTMPPHAAEPARLPIPQLTLDTSQSSAASAYQPSGSYAQSSVSSVSLPPLGSGIRAMSTVYPVTTTTWTSQVPIMATCGPQTPSYTAPANYGTPSKRHSPGSLAVYGSSPLTDLRTPVSNSPSVYLQQRNSPYKPVRPVNTLNYPPPSIPLSEYHLGSAQMHYQSLGRRNVRTGIVPEFVHSFGGARSTHVPVTQAPAQHYHHL